MVKPRLIHPIRVTLEQLDTTNTRYDPITREPIPGAARTIRNLVAQIKWFTERELRGNDAGPQPESKGYLLFRRDDLINAGITIQDGDKVVKLGHRDALLYITGTVPMGHYPDQGGHTLLKANFADREPIQ